MTGTSEISSMTGFARTEGVAEGVEWAAEIRSVNGRGLDLRCRLPRDLEGLEGEIRTAAAKRFSRGNLSLSVSARSAARSRRFRLNAELLGEIRSLASAVEAEGFERPRLDALLGLPGIIETVEESRDEEADARLSAAVLEGCIKALDLLAVSRREEGRRLAPVLEAHLAEIAALAGQASGSAALRHDRIKARLFEEVRELLGADARLDSDRLHQEVALLILRVDVREEVDRLQAHVAGARSVLAEGGAAGRKLDFLCQEFNREANTLCSKANDAELTDIGLHLKGVIDRLREQVQNIE
jgi:uncharacterized protein (TIGR00255 family)